MDTKEWSEFKAELRMACVLTCSVIHFTGEGEGRYEHYLEGSYTVIASCEGEMLALLRTILRALALNHNQESIALTVGQTEFVGVAESL